MKKSNRHPLLRGSKGQELETGIGPRSFVRPCSRPLCPKRSIRSEGYAPSPSRVTRQPPSPEATKSYVASLDGLTPRRGAGTSRWLAGLQTFACILRRNPARTMKGLGPRFYVLARDAFQPNDPFQSNPSGPLLILRPLRVTPLGTAQDRGLTRRACSNRAGRLGGSGRITMSWEADGGIARRSER